MNAKSSFTTVETKFLCSPLGARFDNYLLLIRDQSTYDMLRPRFFVEAFHTWCFEDWGIKVSLWCTLVAVSLMMDYYYSFFNNGILSPWIVSLVTLLKFFFKNLVNVLHIVWIQSTCFSVRMIYTPYKNGSSSVEDEVHEVLRNLHTLDGKRTVILVILVLVMFSRWSLTV